MGSGYAGPAVADGKAYAFHRVGDIERLDCRDAATGKLLWSTDFEASYRSAIDPDSGPRCVPLVHQERVYLFGAAGDLHCVATTNGDKIWSRQAYAELQADEGYFGAGSSPLVLGDVLLVNVGGTPAAGIVAFALDTGQTRWQQTSERASYAAPVRLQLQGHDYACFVTRYNTLAIDPQTGDVRFQFPFGKRGPTVNAAVPLVLGQRLFVSAAYGVGCALVDLQSGAPKTLWANDETLSSQYNTAIYCDEHLYGIHGREDVGRAQLRCVRGTSGQVQWTEPDFGVAHLLLVDQKLLILKVDGTLVLAEPRADRFLQLASSTISPHATRALPAVAGGRLLLRDNRSDGGTLYCLQVGR